MTIPIITPWLNQLPQTVSKHWYSKKPFLGLGGKAISLIYQQLQEIHLDYRKGKAKTVLASLKNHPIPIISVGNLTVGGTGKTPVILSLAKFLESQNHQCLIITKGYKAKKNQSITNKEDAIKTAEEGDEAYYLQTQLSQSWVVATANREALLAEAANLYPRASVIILDDALQAVQLPRDLNIILIDGQLGVGNGCLLPAGPLREPVEQGIKRANLILLTKTITHPVKMLVEKMVEKLANAAPIAECRFTVSGIKQANTGKEIIPSTISKLFLLSGIAHPKSLEVLVQETLNTAISQHFIFPDHHAYQEEDIAALRALLIEDTSHYLITTGKDWVKLKAFNLPSQQVFILEYAPTLDWQTVLSQCAIENPKLASLISSPIQSNYPSCLISQEVHP